MTSENECVVDGKRYVAVEAKSASCAGCAFREVNTGCSHAGNCGDRDDGKLVIWQLATDGGKAGE
jgi:hypothetical protein